MFYYLLKIILEVPDKVFSKKKKEKEGEEGNREEKISKYKVK
jgi:hypothetical protein